MSLTKKNISYLERDFIPNNVSVKTKEDEYGTISSYNYIDPNKVFGITTKYDEFMDIVKYLNSREIYVSFLNYIQSLSNNNSKAKDLYGEEQTNMFIKYKETKDRELLNKLFENNLPLANHIAYRYRGLYNDDYKEAYMTAQEGLFFSIENYDPSKGFKFSTYAYKAIVNYMLRNRFNSNFRISEKIESTKIYFEDKYQQKLYDRGESFESIVEEIANKLCEDDFCVDYMEGNNPSRITKDEVTDFMYISNPLDIADVSEISYSDTSSDLVMESVVENNLREKLNDLLDILSDMEKDVIRRRFGFNGPMQTLREIGDDYGVVRERIRQKEAKALRKLKRNSDSIKGFI